MKNLKYIHLFEAFESNKLSKTLAYAKENKKDFLNRIKKVCDVLSYPYSELNDNFFEYLPFSKALKKKVSVKDEPCKGNSIDEFSSNGIEGETCKEGKLKRKWGSNQRIVTCPRCNGTGIEAKKSGDVKIIKFWFDKDGKYIATTAVDGVNRNSTAMSHKIEDYTIGENIAKTKLRSLPDGSFVKLDYSSWQSKIKDLICYILTENRTVYGIQNKVNGSSPWRNSNWRKVAPYSVELSRDNISNIKLLLPKSQKAKDAYGYNVGFDIGNYNFSVNPRLDVKDLIKEAHFALILDLGKLKESGYKKVTDIKSERKERKSGSKLEMTDEIIKSQNIKRYLDTISKGLNITEDIKNVHKMVKRLIGFRYALYLIITDSNVRDGLNDIIYNYYDLLDTNSEDALGNVNYYVDKHLKNSNENIKRVSSNLEKIRLKLDSHPKEKELLKELDEISYLIFDRVSKMEIETIEDLEILNQKLLAVKNIFNSSRYKIGNVYTFVSYLDSSDYKRPLDYFINYYRVQNNIDNMLAETDRIKKIINKLL